MKIIRYVVVATILFTSFQVFAQQAKTEDPLQSAQMHVSNWAKYIPAVTDDQQKQMVAIENWFITSAKEARDNNDNTDDKVSKVKELSDERNKKIKTILSPAQYSRYLQIYADEAK